jgi:hypothetical protein
MVLNRDYKSNYMNRDFYAEYTEGTQTLMILSGEIEASGKTYHEARTYEYPGSIDTTIQDVCFEGILTVYPAILSDGIDIELTLCGTQAHELLEMFGWDPEESDWVIEDDWYDECADC